MKKLIIFVAFIGCQKEAFIEPETTKQNKIETRDYIDQNFFEKGPEIITQYCKDGSYCFKAVNPIPAVTLKLHTSTNGDIYDVTNAVQILRKKKR